MGVRTGICLGVLIMAGCATWNPREPGRSVDIIAHRGASAYAPENTMAAFRLADEQGADWFELDCTLSKDRRVIVIHDDSVDRTTAGTGKVWDLTLEQIRGLEAGAWKDPKFSGEPLPTLDETLDWAKGRLGVYIEVKDSDDDDALLATIDSQLRNSVALTPDMRTDLLRTIEASGTRNFALAREVVRLVRERHMERQVVVQSFSPIVCAVVMAEAPELRVELLGVDDKKRPEVWEGFLRWGHLLGVDGFNPDKGSVTPGRVAAFHAAGKTISVWTVDDEAEMRRLAEWGVDGIITNRPDACGQVLREMGRR